MGSAPSVEATETFDGVRLERLRVPAAAIAEAVEALDPDVRAALLEAIKRARKVHADQRRSDTTTQVVARRHGHRALGPVARVGLYVPGGLAVYPSTVVMNVVPAQIAGVDSLVVASPPQAANGGLPDTRVLAACGLLGVDEVYAVGGAQAIAMLGYGSDGVDGGSVRPRRRDHRAGQHLGHRREADAARHRRHRRRGRTHRDRDPGRRHRRPGARRRRPDQPGRARPARGERPGHPLARRWRTRSRRSWRPRSPRPGTTSGSHRPDRRAVRDSCWSTTWSRACGWSTRTPRSTWRFRPASRASGPSGSATPGRSSSAPGRRCRWATTRRLDHVLPTGGCARHSSGLSVQSFLRGIHLVEYDEPALRDVAHHVVTLANAEDLPGARPGRAPPGSPHDEPATTCRSATTCGAEPVRGSAARRGGAAQHQRELVRRARTPWSRRSARRCTPSCATSTATRTGTRSRCAPTWPTISGTG